MVSKPFAVRDRCVIRAAIQRGGDANGKGEPLPKRGVTQHGMCHVVITSLEKPIYATPGTKIDLLDGQYVVKANDTIAVGFRADTDDSVETHADTILRFVRDDMTESYSAVALRDRGARLRPWQRFESITAADILTTLNAAALAPKQPATPPQPPPTALPDAEARKTLQSLIDRYNAIAKPQRPLTLRALLKKYPAERAGAAVAAAIQQADKAAVPSPEQKPGPRRKLGYPAHLA